LKTNSLRKYYQAGIDLTKIFEKEKREQDKKNIDCHAGLLLPVIFSHVY
jgi:hypothetical protein